MHDFLDQITKAAQTGLHYPALYSVLTVPDVCAALGADDGRTTGARYAKWFDAEVGPKYRRMVGPVLPPAQLERFRSFPNVSPEGHALLNMSGREYTFLSGDDCYQYRCSVLHQGRSDLRNANAKRVAFAPGAPISHCSQHNDVLVIHLETFCGDVVGAARSWLERMTGTEPFERNRIRLLATHPEGTGAVLPLMPVVY